MLTTHNLSDRGQNVVLTGKEFTLPAAIRWRWIRIWTLCATRAGDGWLWCAIGMAILLSGDPQKFVAVGAATLASLMGLA